MGDTETILFSINFLVQSVVPGAKVFLFGSRAYGHPTEESDWDILILTSQKVDGTLKNEIHTALFPLSVQIGAFINTLTVEENDWVNNPGYYSLQHTIKRMVQA